MKSEKLTALGYGMAGWLIALCAGLSVVCVVCVVGGRLALGYGAPWQGTLLLTVAMGSIGAVVTLGRIVVRSIRAK